jgi:8-oxo-dGTP pyrophosphatase MutT (NUDIX family)
VVQSAFEPVALYDASGSPTGEVAPRGRVYREGLWHAATAVLVRSGHDDDGVERIYVHRRTAEKLIFPGAYDCWAGGVLDPGEEPLEAARRELAEELGITGAPLTPLPRFPYDQDGIRYHVFPYETSWDGPITWQPEEVAWGAWMTLDELRALLADPSRSFAPDGREAIERWLSSRTP